MNYLSCREIFCPEFRGYGHKLNITLLRYKPECFSIILANFSNEFISPAKFWLVNFYPKMLSAMFPVCNNALKMEKNNF